MDREVRHFHHRWDVLQSRLSVRWEKANQNSTITINNPYLGCRPQIQNLIFTTPLATKTISKPLQFSISLENSFCSIWPARHIGSIGSGTPSLWARKFQPRAAGLRKSWRSGSHWAGHGNQCTPSVRSHTWAVQNWYSWGVLEIEQIGASPNHPN